MYTAVIFDLDGTLLDTESLAIQAGTWAHDALGFPAETAFLESMIGKDDITCERLLNDTFPGLDTGELSKVFRQRMNTLEEDGIPMKPGVTDLLDQIDAAGLPCAVATSSNQARADFKLAVTNLRPRFQTVVTLNCVAQAKPAPDAYRLAAQRLGHDPKTCLAFEDSEPGAEAAMAAGMTVVQVPDIVPTQGRFAHHVAPSLLDGARMAGLIG